MRFSSDFLFDRCPQPFYSERLNTLNRFFSTRSVSNLIGGVPEDRIVVFMSTNVLYARHRYYGRSFLEVSRSTFGLSDTSIKLVNRIMCFQDRCKQLMHRKINDLFHIFVQFNILFFFVFYIICYILVNHRIVNLFNFFFFACLSRCSDSSIKILFRFWLKKGCIDTKRTILLRDLKFCWIQSWK